MVQKCQNVSKLLRIGLQNPDSGGAAQGEEHLLGGGESGPRHLQEAVHGDGGG